MGSANNSSELLDIELLKKDLHAALRAWSQLEGNIHNRLDYLLLIQQQRANALDTNPTVLRLAANQILLDGIEELKKQNPDGALILKHRFLDNEKLLRVANKLHISVDQVKRWQREAIEQLCDIIWKKETDLREMQAHAIETTLQPASYTKLFGIDPLNQRLQAYLLSPDSPWLITLVGIGGIGKTSLADYAIRHIIRQFHYEQVIWLRVNNQGRFLSEETRLLTIEGLLAELTHRLYPHHPPDIPVEQQRKQIRHALKTVPYLIVIDNLEFQEDTAYWLTQLIDLTNPSKFLLTSRARLPAHSGAINVPVSELTSDAVLQLIRFHAHEIALTDLAEAADETLLPIHEALGGNPLAIKLAVGLMAVQSFEYVLDDLVKVYSQETEALYHHIYWQAWHSLSSQARALLEIMPLSADSGMEPEQMQALSGLSAPALWPAINELVHLSLLEVRGTTWERRYGIHRLTELFLQTEIIHLPNNMA